MARFATLKEVSDVVSAATGKLSREELVDLVNRIDDIFDLAYGRAGVVRPPIETCIEVQKFCDPCNECTDHWYGIALPQDFGGLEGLKKNGSPYRLRDRWRGYRPDGAKYCTVGLQGWEQASDSVFERGFENCCPTQVKFKFESPDDYGKKIYVRYTGVSGSDLEEEMEGGDTFKPTAQKVETIQPGGLVLPGDLKGGVVAAEASGRVLAEYRPGVSVPSFQRYKLSGVCESDVVLAAGNRERLPLVYDHDVLPLGDLPMEAFRQMALALRYSDDPSTSPEKQSNAAYHEARALEFIGGKRAKREGGNQVRRIDLSQGGYRSRRLRAGRCPV